jgi:hypothetical protein
MCKTIKSEARRTNLKQLAVSERGTSLADLKLPTPDPGYTLNVTLAYQDSQTRAWAREVYEQICKLAGGEEVVRATWWNIGELGEPGVLAGAVSKAIRADAIVLAVRADEGLPLPFYVWINSWLPHRALSNGALVTLVGHSERSAAHAGRVREYFRAVAKEGRLDLLTQERSLPSETVNLAEQMEIGRNGFTFEDLRSRLARNLKARGARLENPFRWDFCGVQVSL